MSRYVLTNAIAVLTNAIAVLTNAIAGLYHTPLHPVCSR